MRKTINIGDLGTIITGKTPPTTNKNYYGDYAVFIKPTDISEQSKYTYETEEMYSKLAAEKYESSLIPKGAICVPCIGTIGTKMTMAPCDCYTNQSINSIICNENYDNEYVYYLIKNFLPGLKAYNLGTASGREYVSKSNFEKIELVAEQDKEIQKKIGVILSRYDSLIENYQKQIKLLEEAAQRLYKEWFVDLHFPGHENTKIIDGVPEGWELKSVTNNHLFNVAKCPIALFNGNKTYYATADVEGTYFCNSGVKIEYDNKPSRAQIQPSLYSVWFARMSNSFKIVGFVEQNNNRREDSILSSGFAGFESHYERFGFLYCLISSQWFNDQKNRYATGATQVSITNEGLSRIRCLLPTTRLAEEFSLVTNKIIEETILYRENCIMLAEARDRLLPKLMSGEIEI